MENNNLTDEQKKSENSRIYVLFYSFFLIPFMIAVFGAVFFLLFKFVTYETNDVEELLNQVKIGSASKRWQSAHPSTNQNFHTGMPSFGLRETRDDHFLARDKR